MTVYSSASEDRVLPAIVYGLYLLGLVTGLPILVGLVVALANTGGAGPRMRTHYIFQSRSVWTALGWWLIGVLLIVFGIPLSLVLVGVPMIVVGALIFAVGHIWFALRCVLGLFYLVKDEAYPRPRAWLL